MIAMRWFVRCRFPHGRPGAVATSTTVSAHLAAVGGAVCGLGLLIAASAFAARPAALATLQPTRGHEIFVAKHCDRCHSVWGVGAAQGPDLGRSALASDMFELAGFFWNHSPKMLDRVNRQGLPWPTFAPDEMEAFLSYLYALNLLDQPGDPESGRRLLEDKHCLDCHRLGGRGGRLGRPLDRFAQWTNPIPLAQAMWNSGSTMRAAQRQRGVRMPVFQDRDMADVQAAIRRWGAHGSTSIHYLSPPDPERGRRLYRSKQCVRCHGARASGGPAGPSLLAASRRKHLGAMAGSLWNHAFAMEREMADQGISLPRFQRQDMADILGYIYFVGFTGTVGGDAERGRSLFAQRGCAQCHSVAGTGLAPGPPVRKLAQLDSPVALVTAMWNHVPQMRHWMQVQALAWPQFRSGDIKDIWLYLSSAKPRVRETGR